MKRIFTASFLLLITLSISTTVFAHGEEPATSSNPIFIVLFYSFLGLLILSGIGFLMASRIKGKKEKERKKKSLINKISLGILGASILLGGIVLFTQDEKQEIENLNKGINIEVIEEEFQGDGHVKDGTSLEYDSPVPTSGAHSEVDIPYGYYPDGEKMERLVHNLEHGDIVIHFNKENINKEELEHLKELATITYQGSGVLLVPNSEIENKLVVAAWTKKLELDEFNDEKISQFIYDYINQGPEKLSLERSINYKYEN